MKIEDQNLSILHMINLAKRAVGSQTRLASNGERTGHSVTLMRGFANQILENGQQLLERDRKLHEALSEAVEFANVGTESDPSGKETKLFEALTNIAQLKLPLSEKKSVERQDFLDFLKENGFEYTTPETASGDSADVYSPQFKYLGISQYQPRDGQGSLGLSFSFINKFPTSKQELLASKALVEAQDEDAKIKAMATLIKLSPIYLSAFGQLLDGLSTDNANKLIEAAFASKMLKTNITGLFREMYILARKTTIPLHKLFSQYSLAKNNQTELAQTIAESIIGLYRRYPGEISQITQFVIPVLYKGNKDEAERRVDPDQRLYSIILEQIFAHSIETTGKKKFPLKAAFERYVQKTENPK